MKRFSVPRGLRNISCIYKFYGKDNELLYIGKTVNLSNRLSQHRSYLPGEDWKDEITRVTYIPENNDCNLDLYETYLVNTLRPKYNKDKIFKQSPTFKLDIADEIEIPLMKYIKKTISFYDVAKYYYEGKLTDEEAFKLYPQLQVIVDRLGKDRLKTNGYNISRLTKELDDLNRYSEFNVEDQIINLFSNGDIKPLVDNFYSISDINCALQKLYRENNLSYKVKSTLISKLFDAKKSTRKINNQTVNGYLVTI